MQAKIRNKSLKLGVIGILLVALTLGLFLGLFERGSVFASANSEMTEKVFNSATMQDNFTDDIILVSLTGEATRKFQEYTVNDFPELRLANVIELTERTAVDAKNQIAAEKSGKFSHLSDINAKRRIDTDSFRRILTLELAEKGKENVLNAINLLEKRSDIRSANPNYIGEFLTNTPSTWEEHQWAIDQMTLRQAWGITRGSSDVIVGVVDSGIDINHPDLAGRINEDLSDDFSGGNDPWYPASGGFWHGTHVAGIIGTNNIGVTGATNNVQIASLKVGNMGPTAAAATAALIHARDEGIDIVNMSFSVDETTEMNDAINSYQGLMVVSAGNSWGTTVGYPARLVHDRIISIGASTRTDACAVYSSRHATQVDVFASGGDNSTGGTGATGTDGEILSTYPEVLNNFHYERGYLSTSGTSMASPYVAAVAALMLSVNSGLSAEDIKEMLMDTVDIPNVGGTNLLNGLCITGGRVNAFAAVSAARDAATPLEYTVISGRNVSVKAKTGATITGHLDIPSTTVINGVTHTVTQIAANGFANQTSLSTLTLPSTVTSIGTNAFYNTGIWDNAGNDSIVYADNWVVGYKGTISGNITLNAGTVGIADYALANCPSSVKFTIPNSLKYIGTGEINNNNISNRVHVTDSYDDTYSLAANSNINEWFSFGTTGTITVFAGGRSNQKLTVYNARGNAIASTDTTGNIMFDIIAGEMYRFNLMNNNNLAWTMDIEINASPEIYNITQYSFHNTVDVDFTNGDTEQHFYFEAYEHTLIQFLGATGTCMTVGYYINYEDDVYGYWESNIWGGGDSCGYVVFNPYEGSMTGLIKVTVSGGSYGDEAKIVVWTTTNNIEFVYDWEVEETEFSGYHRPTIYVIHCYANGSLYASFSNEDNIGFYGMFYVCSTSTGEVYYSSDSVPYYNGYAEGYCNIVFYAFEGSWTGSVY